jgi:ArsR family transcriptional regulator
MRETERIAVKHCRQVKEPKLIELSEDEVRLARMFKALGNPARLAILKRLADCQTCICRDIVASLPLAQSTVSQHLRVLKDAGLISGEVEGPAICYCLNLEELAWLQRQITDFVLLCRDQTPS